MTVADRSVADRLLASTEPPRPVASWYTQGHSDAIGDRLLMFDNTGTPSLELLRFKPEVVATFGFEDALRERVHRLQRFGHPSFPEIRAVEYLEGTDDLTLVSTFTPGKRLADVFRSPRAGLHPAFATWLVRELTPALTDLHQHSPGLSHGAVTPERIVLTPDGRLMIVEHALGAALERVRWGSPEICQSLGIVAPSAPVGASVFDSRTDIIQLAWLTLSVLLGRRLSVTEFPDRVDDLLDEFSRTTAMRSPTLVGPLRKWLEHALHGEGGTFGAALESGSRESQPGRESLLAWKPSLAQNPETAMSNRATASGDSPESSQSDEKKPDSGEVFDSFTPEAPAATPPDPIQRSVFTGPQVATGRPVPSAPRPTPEPGELSGFAPERPARPEATPAPPPAVWPEPAAHPVLPVQPVLRERAPQPDFQAPVQPPIEPIEPEPQPESAPKAGINLLLHRLPLVPLLGGAALVEAALIAVLLFRQQPTAPVTVPITVESLQDGDSVVVDGKLVGITPLKVDVGPQVRSIEIIPRVQDKPAFSEPAVVAAAEPPASPAATAIAAAAAKQKSGGVKINSPIDIQVLEGDRVLGSSADGPIVASAGRHEFDFINPAFGYRARQQVEIRPGQIINLNVTPPGGRVSINAIPWAQVFINGNLVGETPLANMPMPVGEHQVLFRHPQHGERTEKIIVRSGTLTRVSATLGQ